MTTLAISGYRSLRDIRVRLSRLTIVTGANGSGKSSLYRALKLLADIAQGRIIQSLATEGGLQSTVWAGPEDFSRAMKAGTQPVQGLVRKNPISLKLGFSGEDYGYAIDLGLPSPGSALLFDHDPTIKTESLWTGERLGRANAFRGSPRAQRADSQRRWRVAAGPHGSRAVRQHDDPVQRSARGDRTHGAARANAGLALLRSHEHRPRRTGAQAAGRHLYAGAGVGRIGSLPPPFRPSG